MNRKIRNIIFDFGNVIVDLDRDGMTRRFAEQGVDVTSFVGLAVQKGIFLDLEMGRIDPDEWCEKVVAMAPEFLLADRPLTLTPEGVKEAWCSMLTGVPLRRLQALTWLGERYHLALLSNTNQIHVEHSFNKHFRSQGYEPKDMFEHLFLSNEMQLAKPGRAIFERVLEESGYRPEETLFVDDCQENCDAFAQLGVKTFCPKYPDEWLGALRPAVATIGFFDGVHRGHQFLIDEVKSAQPYGMLAERSGARTSQKVNEDEGSFSLIVTFAEHPRAVLQSDYVPELLTSPQEKLALLKQTGVDGIEMLHFTPELSRLAAKEFMQQILCNRLGVKTLVMGYDHRFGHGGGTLEEYLQWGREVGIEVIKASELPQTSCSSSVIRKLLSEGKVAEANELLGHPYTLQGKVVPGHQVGHELGFPTANLQPSVHKLVPMNGVYAVWAEVEGGKRYRGMLNIGERPTIDNSSKVTIEVNLLDFEGDLYGRDITLHFVQFLRPERKFGSREELVEQIKNDQCMVRDCLG